MPTRFNSRSSSNVRTRSKHPCTLSLLTVAVLMAGAHAVPAMAATDAQPASRSVGNYTLQFRNSHWWPRLTTLPL